MSPDEWLESYFGQELFSGSFGHLHEVVDKLNLRPQKKKIVTIAGSNGKGQTSRILHGLLTREDVSSVMWTSPHLYSVTERFIYMESEIEKSDLTNLFLDMSEELKEYGFKLSYYEFLFVCLLKWVGSLGCSVIILEVGLGGRLDAVNVLDTNLAMITSISRDHQEFLGKTYQEILKEKLGIVRANTPLITAFNLKYLREKTLAHLEQEPDLATIRYYDLYEDKILSSLDDFSTANNKMALAGFKELVGKSTYTLGIKNEKRSSIRFENVKYDFFPSHNPDGVRKLVQFLSQAKYNYTKCIVSFSKRDERDLVCMLKSLILFFGRDSIVLMTYDHPKGISEEVAQRIGKAVNVEYRFNYKKDEFLKDSEVLVTGSNYFLSFFSTGLTSK